MGDKRFMDNKVIRNPLLSNVDQNSFLEELVQNPLLVPAAPSKLPETTVDAAKSNQDKNVEKPFLTGNTLQETRVATAASISSSSGTVTEKLCEISPQISQPKQIFSEPPTIKASVLTEIPLDKSQTFTSTALPPALNKSTLPPNFSGPPPLTSYNRPVNKLPTSRYPTSSFLQTVPSAQYFSSQSNPNTPSISPSASLNFQKSSSSSPVTFFVPQQQQQLSTESPGLGNISKSSSATSFTSETSQALNTSISTNSNNYKTFSSLQSNIDSTTLTKSSDIQQKQISVTPSHGITHTQSLTNQSICNPVNVSPPSLSSTLVHNIVPSLPVSQSIIVSSSPTLISNNSDSTQQSENVFVKTCETYFSTDGFKNVLLDKESFKSVYQPTSDSSSVLRSRSPSPNPTCTSQLQASHISTVSTPVVIQPFTTSVGVNQVNTVVTASSEVVTQSPSFDVSSNIASSASNNLVSITETASATLTQSTPSHLGSFKSNITESSLTSNLTQTQIFPPVVAASPPAASSVSANVPALTPISSSDPSSTFPLQSNPYCTKSVEVSSFESPAAPLVSTTLFQSDPSSVAVSECSTYFQPIAVPGTESTTNSSLETQPVNNSPTTSTQATNINYKSPSNLFSLTSDTSFPVNQIFLDSSVSDDLFATSSITKSSKTPISDNSNLNKSVSPTNIIDESHSTSETTCTLKNKEEKSELSSPVNIQPQVPLTVTSATSVPQSLTHPPLFTFNSLTPSKDLPLSQPPKQPYVQSAPISSSKHFHPSSSPLPANTFSNSITSLGADNQEIPVSSSVEFPAQKSVFLPTVPLSGPPLLDPSQFFSAQLPSLTDQFTGKSSTESNTANTSTVLQDGNSPQALASSSFSSLNQSSPATLPTLQTYTQLPPPSQAPTGSKQTTLQNNFPTSLPPSSTPPTVAPSHTPPPPYSSLFNKTETQSGHKEQLASFSTHVVPNEYTANPQTIGTVKEEELDQIPLDGDTIPLYNPQYLGTLSQTAASATKGGTCNTYRLGSGLKRPVYAPVPDLGITHQLSPFVPTMSGPPPLQPVTTISPTTVSSPSVTRSSSVASSPPSESATFNYNAQGQVYRPAYHHWFYKKGGESKSIWQPFSMADSLNLEQVFTSPELNENTKVATDGGRYDVEIMHRRKVPVYWEESPGEVRRCSWFVRAPIESRYIPYDENIAEILEDAFKTGCIKNEWNRRVELADGEVIILHSPNAIAHHQRSSSPDAWGNPPTMQQKPRIVKRGLEDFEISEGEPNQVDHLLLMVHGIGKVCDLRFRSLVQVVDDFRNVSLQLIQSHFRSGTENGNVGRVEVLPVEWHRALHTETIDKRLADITLPSIPKAREFTNDVLLDILFYTSPVFCERIVQAVGAEINRVYTLYMSRNPGFRGGVSLGGHSLGSLILFDMLCHQKPHRSMKSAFSPQSSIHEGDEDMPEVGCLKAKARLSRRMSYLTIGTAGTGQPYIIYPQLHFQPKAFFALGSPIGMFLTVRGIEGLGEDFKFPTCPKFFNIFHPNDPVAYRIEALVSPQMIGIPAVVIPHHKGRKRMHLELKDTMAHVTAALKQKLIDSMRSTWNTVYQLALFHRPDSSLQQEVDKVIEHEILTNNDCANESASANHLMLTEDEALDLKVGNLNGGDRIDYVLQEAPLETFNQYISAVRSHVVYWESEDTMLLILKELYATMGISPDCQVPQPILPFDISSDTSKETYSEYTDSIGAPPTQFIRK